MSKRRRLLPKRSPREWAIRGVLAAAAAVAGSFSVAHTLAQVVVKDDPAFAHRLAPWDGRITAALAASLAKLDATPADRARAEELAILALRQDPTAVAAASTLGINAQLRGDQQRARHFFTYAQKLSRRELPAQLWAIEDAVARGDIPGALKHYDIALRTRRESWDLLFPVLTAASADPQVRRELVRTLAAKPLWSDAFVHHAVANGADAKATAQLLISLKQAGVDIPPHAHAKLIAALADGGSAEDAWRYYATMSAAPDRRKSRDPRFTAEHEAPTLFDWATIDNVGLVTTIHSESNGGLFDFSAPSSLGGPMLQQMQMLLPGTYRLAGHSIGIDQAPGALPYWSLTCRTGGRELGRVIVPNSSRDDGNFSGNMTVPANCPVQILTLVARASDAMSGLSGQIDRIELAPIQ